MEELNVEETENSGDLVEGVKNFMQGSRRCVLGSKAGPCSEEFSEEAVCCNLNNCVELTNWISSFWRIFRHLLATILLERNEREACDAVCFSTQNRFLRKCFYIYTELDIPDFDTRRSITKRTVSVQELTVTQTNCLEMPCLIVLLKMSKNS